MYINRHWLVWTGFPLHYVRLFKFSYLVCLRWINVFFLNCTAYYTHKYTVTKIVLFKQISILFTKSCPSFCSTATVMNHEKTKKIHLSTGDFVFRLLGITLFVFMVKWGSLQPSRQNWSWCKVKLVSTRKVSFPDKNISLNSCFDLKFIAEIPLLCRKLL